MQYHEPVLLEEILDSLRVKKNGKYIDCTLGDGGHAIEILKLGGKVLGIDLDEGSLERASRRIKEEGLDKNFVSVKGSFKDIERLAKENGFSEVDGILFDLGYSSTQLEDLEIGLSFSKDQDLDMRLDKSLGVKAADLVNALSEKELTQLFSEYGEEKYSKRFANAVVNARELKRFETTKDLVDVIKSASPGYEPRLHPATRVFQALRIAVNDELGTLKMSLPWAAHLLLPGGRMSVIAFHSLEDRIVKQFGRGALPVIKEVVRKPITPSDEEVKRNVRSRSAKLRIFEKE